MSGSDEIFIAKILEHTKENLPLWLSPRQICIILVANKYNEYSNEIKSILLEKFDDSTETMNKKKIRNTEILKFNYIIVIGEKIRRFKIYKY